MATILLVEDDKSLREIYAVRLQAEGYTIVTANDGEEALAVAIKIRPILIITDVMMPKISGFDMLDILRSTAETKDIKVIMMTALSSDDQRNRGEQIGADRYLVKSQVGIEDVVRTVHDILGDQPAAPPAPAEPPTAATPPTAEPPVSSLSVAPDPTPTPHQPAPATTPAVLAPTAPASPMPAISSTTPPTPSSRQRIIQPINDPHAKVDISDLLDKELAKEAGLDMSDRPQVATTEQEKAIINNQIQEATAPVQQQAPVPAPATPQMPAQPASREVPAPPQRIFDVTPPRPQAPTQ